MASIPDDTTGTGAGATTAPPPPAAPAAQPVTVEELQRARRVTPAQGAAILDGLLAALAGLEDAGRRAGRLDAGTVRIVAGGSVALAEPAGVPAAPSASTDVTAAALVVRPLVAGGGRRLGRVRHLVDATVEGRSARSAADLRRQLGAAAAPLGEGWNEPAVLLPLLAPAGAGTVHHRRRRWPWLAAAVVLLLAGAGLALWLTVFAAQSPGKTPGAPLSITTAVTTTVSPASGSCNTTFVFHATASVSGSGLLVYRWEQSDGQTSDNQSVRVTPSDGSFDVTQSWRIQGAQTVTGKETFHIVQPVDRTAAVSFQYHCP